MFFLIAIAFLLKRYGTHAVPLPAPTPTFSVFGTPDIFARDDSSNGRHSRTVLDILWSCLATIFACTWVSVHPNVPFKGEGKWTLLSRRIFLMTFSILAPEFMIMWAFKQWRGAVMIKRTINEVIKAKSGDNKNPIGSPWTTTHGHFLQMGGLRLSITQRENFFSKGLGCMPRNVAEVNVFRFGGRFQEVKTMRHEDPIDERTHYKHERSDGSWTTNYTPDNTPNDNIWEGVLTINSLRRLLSEDLICLPIITEDEINDRSKGDAVSKGIALLQLTWFIIQIISRAVQGLAITELELTTAALAGLNSAMYIFWWSKPRDVRFPVVIRTRSVEEILWKKAKDATKGFSDREIDRSKHLRTSRSDSEALYDASVRSGIKGSQNPTKAHQHINSKSSNKRHATSTVALHEDNARMEPNSHAIVNGPRSTMHLAALLIFFPLYLIDVLFIIPSAMILSSGAHNASFCRVVGLDYDIKAKQEVFSRIFYSEDTGGRPLLCTSSIAGALFGAVHCLAWNFIFPSHVEQVMWRVGSMAVVVTCVAVLFITLIYDDHAASKGIFRFMVTIVGVLTYALASFLYPVFRVTLLALAITSLRSLPPSVFDTVDWVELVPHI